MDANYLRKIRSIFIFFPFTPQLSLLKISFTFFFLHFATLKSYAKADKKKKKVLCQGLLRLWDSVKPLSRQTSEGLHISLWKVTRPKLFRLSPKKEKISLIVVLLSQTV